VKKYVLDSSAVLSFLEERPGAEEVESLLAKATGPGHSVLMSIVTWGELDAVIRRERGGAAARAKIEAVQQLPIEPVEFDADLAALAAELSGQYRVSYLTAVSAATAKARKAVLITSEKEAANLSDQVKVTVIGG